MIPEDLYNIIYAIMPSDTIIVTISCLLCQGHVIHYISSLGAGHEAKCSLTSLYTCMTCVIMSFYAVTLFNYNWSYIGMLIYTIATYIT